MRYKKRTVRIVMHTAITTYILSWLLIISLMPGLAESAEDWANNKKPGKKNITDRHSRVTKYSLIIK